MPSRVGDRARDSLPVRVVPHRVVEIVVIVVIVVDDRRMLDLLLLPPLLAALDALLDLLHLGTTRRVLLLLLDGEDVDAVSRRRRARCDHRAREDDGAKGAHTLVMAHGRAVGKRKILVKIVILLPVYIDFCAKMAHVRRQLCGSPLQSPSVSQWIVQKRGTGGASSTWPPKHSKLGLCDSRSETRCKNSSTGLPPGSPRSSRRHCPHFEQLTSTCIDRRRQAETGGRRDAHGRAASSCAASRNSVASSPKRATKCDPIGNPSAVQ